MLSEQLQKPLVPVQVESSQVSRGEVSEELEAFMRIYLRFLNKAMCNPRDPPVGYLKRAT